MKVAVTASDNRPVLPSEFEAITSILSDHEIVRIDVPDAEGGVSVELDDEIVEVLSSCDAIIHRLGHLSAHVLNEYQNLQIISLMTSGFDHIDLESATELDILVTHSPDSHAEIVSEGTIALMFSVVRSIPAQANLVGEGRWKEARSIVTDTPSPLISQTVVGVIGLGTIGFKVARKLSSLGADVVGYDPYVSDTYRSAVEEIGVDFIDTVQELFSRSSIVTLHTPLNDETYHMVGQRELSALDHGYLINAARGAIVDERALIEAVKDGTLAGVGLDVLEDEPPAPDNELLSFPNVIITPHTTGTGNRPPEQLPGRLCALNVARYFDGLRPRRMLNPAVFDRKNG